MLGTVLGAGVTRMMGEVGPVPDRDIKTSVMFLESFIIKSFK